MEESDPWQYNILKAKRAAAGAQLEAEIDLPHAEGLKKTQAASVQRGGNACMYACICPGPNFIEDGWRTAESSIGRLKHPLLILFVVVERLEQHCVLAQVAEALLPTKSLQR
jgi:hypothetical protein